MLHHVVLHRGPIIPRSRHARCALCALCLTLIAPLAYADAPWDAPFPGTGIRYKDEIVRQSFPYAVTDTVRLREAPSTSAPESETLGRGRKIAVLAIGAEATVDGVSANWVEVLAEDGSVGWCSAGFLDPEPGIPSAFSGDEAMLSLLCHEAGLPGDTVLSPNETLALDYSLSRAGENGPDDPLLLNLKIRKKTDLPDTLSLAGHLIVMALPESGDETVVYSFDSFDEIEFYIGSGSGGCTTSMLYDNYVLQRDDGYVIDSNEETAFLPGPPKAGSYAVMICAIFDDGTWLKGDVANITLWE